MPESPDDRFFAIVGDVQQLKIIRHIERSPQVN